jgi:NAD(P)-dependent dehydrogenase (short-subunit alcohol dehydrogenase family)
MTDLAGRTALVTGGARGMGRDVALTLARRGASVIAVDILTEQLAELSAISGTQDLSIITNRMDVTSVDDWAAMADLVKKKFNKLDILVNTAGITESKSFFDTTLDDFRKMIRVNLESMFIGAKAMFDLLKRAGQENPAGASMINFSSVYGQIAGPWSSAYCASKGGVRLLTKALAVDFAQAKANIRVNSIHPGAIDTPMLRKSEQFLIEQGVVPDTAAFDAMVNATTPMGRMGKVDDISGVVAFLASDDAKFMTGSEITVDGGSSVI